MGGVILVCVREMSTLYLQKNKEGSVIFGHVPRKILAFFLREYSIISCQITSILVIYNHDGTLYSLVHYQYKRR